MLTMLNLRIVAAISAAQIFVLTVLWPNAHPLLGPLLGAGAGAAVFAVGRVVLHDRGLRGTEREAARQATAYLWAATVGAAAVVTALSFVIRGAAGGVPWPAVIALGLGLVLLGFASVRLTRLTRDAAAAGERVDC